MNDHERRDGILYIAKWRNKIPSVRAAVKALTGVDTAGIIPDQVLAGVAERSDKLAEAAAGSDQSMTLAEARGVAAATATAAVAEFLCGVRAARGGAEWMAIEEGIALKAGTPAVIDKRGPGGGRTTH